MTLMLVSLPHVSIFAVWNYCPELGPRRPTVECSTKSVTYTPRLNHGNSTKSITLCVVNIRVVRLNILN